MFGAVAWMEYRFGLRATTLQLLQRLYTIVLLLEFLGFSGYYAYVAYELQASGEAFYGNAIGACVDDLLTFYLAQHFLLLFLVTPAFTAGAISDDKTRGNLELLLSSRLSPWEIIGGKLCGRLAQVGRLTLAAVPLLGLLAGFGGLGLETFVLVLFLTVGLLLALGSISVLASVWSRRSRDAMLYVYLLALAVAVATPFASASFYLEPLARVLRFLETGRGIESGLVLLGILASTLALGGAALGLAVWRLRPAYARQLEVQRRPRKTSWWERRRPEVSDDALRWKEQHLEPLLPFARRWRGSSIPALVLFAVVAVLLSGSILFAHTKQPSGMLKRLEVLDSALGLARTFRALGPVSVGFLFQGGCLLFLGSVLVGLRCSEALTRQREQRTWEALLLTPLTTREILDGILRGTFRAVLPYLLAFGLPMIVVAWFGDLNALIPAVVTVCLAWPALYGVGAVGLWCSARARSSWRALLGWSLGSFVVSAALYLISLIAIGMAVFIVQFFFVLFDAVGDKQSANTLSLSFKVFAVGVTVVLSIGFGGMTRLLLLFAAEHIARTERVMHWPRRSRRRNTEALYGPLAMRRRESLAR